jgi:hypothetical protein
MVTLTQEDIKKLFEYLNTQPYKFSAPIFEFFYAKMNSKTETSPEQPQSETEVPKTRTKTKP